MTKFPSVFNVNYKPGEISPGVLTPEEYQEWVLVELDLVQEFVRSPVRVSELKAGDPILAKLASCEEDLTLDGAKLHEKMMMALDRFFLYRARNCWDVYCNFARDRFAERLEMPALFRNFVYFRIPESDAMIQFFLNVWNGNMANVMDLLQNEAPYFRLHRLDGSVVSGPEANDPWARMSHFEAMNVAERGKAEFLATELHAFAHAYKRPPKITTLGAGNLPERFWGLPKTKITAFDNAPGVLGAEEIFPGERKNDGYNLRHLRFYRESLFKAKQHAELIGTQDFVALFGISMYYNDKEFARALEVAACLLREGGEIFVNYVILTDSMRRVAFVQGWPVSAQEMQISETQEQALARAERNVAQANSLLCAKNSPCYLRLSRNNKVSALPNWGVQGVIVRIQKVRRHIVNETVWTPAMAGVLESAREVCTPG